MEVERRVDEEKNMLLESNSFRRKAQQNLIKIGRRGGCFCCQSLSVPMNFSISSMQKRAAVLKKYFELHGTRRRRDFPSSQRAEAHNQHNTKRNYEYNVDGWGEDFLRKEFFSLNRNVPLKHTTSAKKERKKESRNEQSQHFVNGVKHGESEEAPEKLFSPLFELIY